MLKYHYSCILNIEKINNSMIRHLKKELIFHSQKLDNGDPVDTLMSKCNNVFISKGVLSVFISLRNLSIS